jgi:hypothetical protein
MNTAYFGKRTPEEENPTNVELQVQNKYKELDDVFEKFFEESNLSLAKVN